MCKRCVRVRVRVLVDLKGQVHGSLHAHLSKCCFSAWTFWIVYASNMIMS